RRSAWAVHPRKFHPPFRIYSKRIVINSANAHVILRGARLKNTDNIYGIVLYTGRHTKLFKSGIRRTKKRLMEPSLRSDAIALGYDHLQFTTCKSSELYSLMSIFLQHLVLFSGFIPISLYVTLELGSNNTRDIYT
ncbi:hypothetical protein COOONC_13804, partial [Cooperia oncophora]